MDIAQEVTRILVEDFDVDSDACKEQANLVTDLDLDSLEMLELAGSLDDYFGIEVNDEDFQKVQTVGDIVSFIKARKSQ